MCNEQKDREFITRNIDREPVNVACVYVLYMYCLRTPVLSSAFIAQHLSLFDCVCGKQRKVIFLFCFTDSAGPLMFQMINFCTKHPINLFFKPAFFISSCPGLSSLCFVSVLKGIAPRFYSSYLSRVTAECLSDQNSLLSFT